ncbi:MAG: cytochrome c [Gammaproteobacteria bacterium]|nr:cytochrome c [Gammaproteobacteria bacterium]
MKILPILAITLIVGLLAVVGFAYSGLYDVSANSPHSSLVSWLLSTASHASIERRAKGIEVPRHKDNTLALAGIGDFDSMCAACHGAPGRDPEAMGLGLNPPAPDLAESAKEMTAAELFWVTKNGIKMTGMPAWGKTHGDDELWPVIAFLVTLPELDPDAYNAMLVSAAGMGHHADDAPAGAHSHDGQDGKDAANEHSGPAGRDQPADHEESPAQPEQHDHGTHEH